MQMSMASVANISVRELLGRIGQLRATWPSTQARVTSASHLLGQIDIAIADIAEQAGFQHSHHGQTGLRKRLAIHPVTTVNSAEKTHDPPHRQFHCHLTVSDSTTDRDTFNSPLCQTTHLARHQHRYRPHDAREVAALYRTFSGTTCRCGRIRSTRHDAGEHSFRSNCGTRCFARPTVSVALGEIGIEYHHRLNATVAGAVSPAPSKHTASKTAHRHRLLVFIYVRSLSAGDGRDAHTDIA
jgi:hypothetical protein